MHKLSDWLGGNGGLIAAAVFAAFLLGLAALTPIGRGLDPQATATDPARTAPQTRPGKDRAGTTSDNETVPATSKTDKPAQSALQIDELRREPDGTTVVAMRAAPGADVAVMVNGKEVARGTADSFGAVAAVTLLPDFDTAQVFELRQTSPDGQQQRSEELVTLLPRTLAEAPDVPALPKVNTQSGQAAVDDVEPPAQTMLTQTLPAQAPPGPVIKTTKQGVELLNTPAPELIDNLALDTISYSDLGAVQLAGRAQARSRQVRVYLDNASVVTLDVDPSGRWRGDLPDVDEGVYTLRVDELDEKGEVTSRVETPFKRESPAVLAAAAQAQNGPVKAVTVQKGATLWAIARDRYGDGLLYVRVFEANADAIRNPDLIYPGQVFDLPN